MYEKTHSAKNKIGGWEFDFPRRCNVNSAVFTGLYPIEDILDTDSGSLCAGWPESQSSDILRHAIPHVPISSSAEFFTLKDPARLVAEACADRLEVGPAK